MADPKFLAIDSIVHGEVTHDVHGVMKMITITCAEGARWSADPQQLNDTLVFTFHCKPGDTSEARAYNQSLMDLERMCKALEGLAKAHPHQSLEDEPAPPDASPSGEEPPRVPEGGG